MIPFATISTATALAAASSLSRGGCSSARNTLCAKREELNATNSYQVHRGIEASGRAHRTREMIIGAFGLHQVPSKLLRHADASPGYLRDPVRQPLALHGLWATMQQ
mmetsp:Transcript_6441/g.12470  ORF Transcript_6441/g.12470 Transcript_6441/m.12470 type:complete len:107 (+) Transcript_6441:3-323(+)